MATIGQPWATMGNHGIPWEWSFKTSAGKRLWPKPAKWGGKHGKSLSLDQEVIVKTREMKEEEVQTDGVERHLRLQFLK